MAKECNHSCKVHPFCQASLLARSTLYLVPQTLQARLSAFIELCGNNCFKNYSSVSFFSLCYIYYAGCQLCCKSNIILRWIFREFLNLFAGKSEPRLANVLGNRDERRWRLLDIDKVVSTDQHPAYRRRNKSNSPFLQEIYRLVRLSMDLFSLAIRFLWQA